MATSSPENTTQLSDVLAELEAADQFQAPSEGGAVWQKWAFRLVLVGAAVGLGAFGVVQWAGSFESRGSDAWLTYPVKRGELLVTIVEDGNLESSQNVDIKCEVAGGSTILSIVEDGKEVKEGDELVRLDSAQLEDQINQQRIAYEKARATHIQSDKDYEVAKISVQEYQEGTFRQQLQDLEAKVTIALENLRSAENSLQHTQRMFRKGYVSPLQLETQQFAVERSKLDLESAKTAKDVLERFTKVKTLQDLQSKRDTAEAKKNSDKAAFDLEEARLKRLETQLKKCVIHAPKSGMVVYANEQNRMRFGGQQTSEIKEGAVVREQQAILRLPDLGKMQVRCTVHESKVDRIRPGMRARIRIQDREFQGTVVSVANQPEPSGFHSAAVKEYATVVKLEGDTKGIRPGMTAEVEILVAHLKDVLPVPVAGIFEHRGVTYCCVKDGPKVDKRVVELGMTNDKYVEVRSGLQEGMEVVLNPGEFFQESKEEARQREPVDVAKKFGASKGEPGGILGAGPGTAANNPRPGEEGKQRSKSRGSRGGFDLAQFDKDGDGKISRDEAPDQLRGLFDKLDTNGDGFIDRAEANAMRARMKGVEKGGPGGPKGLPGGMPPGDPTGT